MVTTDTGKGTGIYLSSATKKFINNGHDAKNGGDKCTILYISSQTLTKLTGL